MDEQKTAAAPLKGFRTPPKPTKGEVRKENHTLGQELRQRIQNMQQFYGNMINQVMRTSQGHEQELTQLARWLGSAPTGEPAQQGDHLILDYAGVLLNDDGTPATVPLEVGPNGENRTIPDYFDGGSGKFFMLTNLGGGTMITGFEEQLYGLRAGEGKEVEVQFPKEYGVKNLQGKKARFTIYVHAVQRPYGNSPVGELIDENNRVRAEARKANAAREKQKRDAEAKNIEESKAAAETNEGSTPPPGEQPTAEAPTPEVEPVDSNGPPKTEGQT